MIKGQLQLGIVAIGGLLTLVGSIGGAWVSASSATQKEIGGVNTKIEVVQERENNHYLEVKGTTDRIEKKIDMLLEQRVKKI